MTFARGHKHNQVRHGSWLFSVKALLDGGADPEHGNPNAMQCVTMFKQEDVWKGRFDAAPGRNKAKGQGGGPSL
jgi:hypothetical protein